ncbi:MAG: Fur family transcriptional regulator [Candidatus Saccharibacteria bacterium]|nr:Fur family transcriptional regulator [Candidatus Saccharibacteria bacterium]
MILFCYMSQNQLFIKILRDSNYSATKARLFVFDLLLKATGPQTMHQLIEASKGIIDRVSVYRVIELYEKLGIAQRINIGWKYKIELSDIFLEHHHHMTCLGCGRVIAVKDDPAFEAMINRLGETHGFVLKQHQLEMQGYCDRCGQGHVS